MGEEKRILQTVPHINTRELDLNPIVEVLRDEWLEFHWDRATFEHGSFHGVVVVDDRVVRVCVGAAHADRAEAEALNTKVFGSFGLPFALPSVIRGPHSTANWTATAFSRVAGELREMDDWSDARLVYLPIIEALRSVAVDEARSRLRPLRDWCGGAAWAELVEQTTAALDERYRRRATQLVREVETIEAGDEPVLLHGDLHPFNLRVAPDWLGLIDLDNAAVGDPALEIVWFVRKYPHEELRRDFPLAHLRRAAVHSAAGPLKIAAAARLIGDDKLVAHALGSFVARTDRE